MYLQDCLDFLAVLLVFLVRSGFIQDYTEFLCVLLVLPVCPGFVQDCLLFLAVLLLVLPGLLLPPQYSYNPVVISYTVQTLDRMINSILESSYMLGISCTYCCVLSRSCRFLQWKSWNRRSLQHFYHVSL